MKSFLLAILILPASLIAQKSFELTGKVTGLPEGSAVSLSSANSQGDTVARSTVRNGVFQLKGTLEDANLLQLNFDGVQKKSVVFIGNEKVTVSGNVAAMQDLKVSGSLVHDDFEQFKTTFQPLFERLTSLGQRISSGNSAGPNDSLMKAYRSQVATIGSEVDRFITKHQASPVAAFLLVVVGQMEQDASATESRYNRLDAVAKNSFFGRMLKQQVAESNIGAIGSQAIDFSQASPDGQMVSLSSFRGKYVLVDFWASWCRPCRVENPNVVRAFQKFKSKNFTVLGVSLDRDKKPWVKAIKDDNLTWTQVSDLKFWNNEAAAKYNIQSIPQNFLVDPNGKIVAKNLRGKDLEDRLCELLGCR